MTFSVCFAVGAQAAAFESSVVGIFNIETPQGQERYIVLRPPSDRPGEYQFFPIDLRLRSIDGSASLSVVVTRSPLFDDSASFGITAGFEFATSAQGLSLLKSAVAERTMEPNPRFAPLGNVQYKLYIFLAGRNLNEEGLIAANLDSGSAAIQSAIATTFRVDSIDLDQLRNLLNGEEISLHFVMALNIPYTITMTAAPIETLPVEALADIFDGSADLPLLPLYERQLASTSMDSLEQDLARISDLAFLLMGTTPILNPDTGRADWNLNLQRLEEQTATTTLTKVIPVNDVVRSMVDMSNICRDFADTVVDADALGELCN